VSDRHGAANSGSMDVNVVVEKSLSSHVKKSQQLCAHHHSSCDQASNYDSSAISRDPTELLRISTTEICTPEKGRALSILFT